MSEKNEVKRYDLTTRFYEAYIKEAKDGDYVEFDDYDKERLRADEWKAMAKRLYQSAICDCTEGGGIACHRCLSTIQAYTNLAAKEKGAG